MKIAIVKTLGFAPEWIAYCKSHGIDYKIVNPYDSDIVSQVSDCDAFMWHHSHGSVADLLFAKQLLASLEASGKKVFPDVATGWHFDDKVGEMYLLQALGLPVVPSYVFYDKASALAWADKTDFPKVFKLRGGAGSMNVMLVDSKRDARRIIRRCFGRGFKAFRAIDYFKDRYGKWRDGRDTLLGVAKALVRFVIPPKGAHLHQIQKGYAYFQDFMPGNNCDTRVTVVGASTGSARAMAFRRGVRPGDFRASGSGEILYDNIDTQLVALAIDAAKKMHSACTAFDFIYDADGNPRIVETSYGFVPEAIDRTGGYWDEKLQWHDCPNLNVCGMMIENLLKEFYTSHD